jgi:hypothetical protein
MMEDYEIDLQEEEEEEFALEDYDDFGFIDTEYEQQQVEELIHSGNRLISGESL